jgi:hypothetical protein
VKVWYCHADSIRGVVKGKELHRLGSTPTESVNYDYETYSNSVEMMHDEWEQRCINRDSFHLHLQMHYCYPSWVEGPEEIDR